MPVDQPFLHPAYLRQMLKKWRNGAQIVAPQVDGTVRGAPALFDRQLWRELLLIRGDVGGRILLERHRDAIETVLVPGAFLRDIDEPSDLGC